MKASKNAYEMIMYFEGFRSKAYRDPVGVWTIGYGHTGRVGPGMRIDEDEGYALLIDDVEEAEFELDRLLARPLSQHEYDAMIDFIFNFGAEKLRTSTLLRKVNAGLRDASNQFLRWTKIKDPITKEHRVLLGLLKRRQSEKLLYDTGVLVLEWPDIKV